MRLPKKEHLDTLPQDKLTELSKKIIHANQCRGWESYQFTLMTPMYGGGTQAAQCDDSMPIRATAIRGQLRYWWRFLRLQELGDNKENREALYEQVFKEEVEVWGKINDEDNTDSNGHSYVALRVVTDRSSLKKYKYQNEKLYPLYALFPAKEQKKPIYKNREKVGYEVTREADTLACSGMMFSLLVKFKNMDEGKKQSVLQAISWWSTFGGVGARTRRGVGSIYPEAGSGVSLITAEEAKSAGCQMEFLPSLYSTAEEAWEKSVDRLYCFRQGSGVGRNPGQNPLRPGRSRWPEPDSVREKEGTHHELHAPEHVAISTYPRASFGLPITIKFSSKEKEPKPSELTPQVSDRAYFRAASPLFLTPYFCQESKRFKGCALLLPSYIEEYNLIVKTDGGEKSVFTPAQWNNKLLIEKISVGKKPISTIQQDNDEEATKNEVEVESGEGSVLDIFMRFFSVDRGSENA